MKRLLGALFALALCATLPAVAATKSASGATTSKSMMPTCKGAVVYAVPADKIYYMKGETMYGHAKGGTYMCQAAANGKGYKHKV